jgi:3,4-dihydroxy 2-butanone 4-phosphate synthase/GTP cyclohydrolase II
LLNCAQDATAVLAEAAALSAPARNAATRLRPGKMDLRTYGIGAQILKDLGVGRMRLLSRPIKMPSMAGFSLEIVGFESMAQVPGA